MLINWLQLTKKDEMKATIEEFNPTFDASFFEKAFEDVEKNDIW